MLCPHCRISFHENWFPFHGQAPDVDGTWNAQWTTCPSCNRPTIVIMHFSPDGTNEEDIVVYPKTTSRPPVPPEVPPEYAEDYTEACLVLTDSPKASAALSRRCLQSILVNVAKAKGGDLAKQIDDVLNSKQLPSYLADDIDAVRAVGNFAAHPVKYQNTGALVPVESGEADWLLEVLEGLFDFYFVAPAKAATRRLAFNDKQTAAGKPSLKQPPS